LLNDSKQQTDKMENSTMLEYERFLESKRHIPQNFGIDPLWIPDTKKNISENYHYCPFN